MPRENRSYRRRSRSRSTSRERKSKRSRSRSVERSRRSRSVDKSRRSQSRERKRSRSRERKRSRDRLRRSKSRDRSRRSRSRDRDRRRSRDRERRRSRSRDRSRRSRSRERERDRKRDKRSRSKTPAKEKSKSKTPERKLQYREGAISTKDEPLDKEEEQKRLEIEMQKRRERIEMWRVERKKTKELLPINIAPPTKKWSLEDDDDEDIEVSANKDDDDTEDALDAYMKGLSSDNPKKKTENGNADGVSKVKMVTGVAKVKKDTSKNKGELMENNVDALEYSSEEEEEGLDVHMAKIKNTNKKELVAVDHDRIYYAPFRSDFYVEVPEIAKMSNEEVDAYRAELEDIKVRGKNCPRPIKKWAHCGCSKKVMEIMKKQQYEMPTPIQAQAIPVIMNGKDMIGIAKTGSGKTLAFLTPMFRHIMDQPELDEDDGPIAIIMTPTRELAMQITTECKKFTKSLALKAVCVYGGTGISEQIAELKRGCEIIVCTPGRMIDMLSANSGRVTNLRRCTYVVLDEADRMFDMGFEPQVTKILDNVRPDRQTVMFSATFPRQMEALARRILNKPIEVQVGGRSVVCKEVDQHVVSIYMFSIIYTPEQVGQGSTKFNI